MIATKRALAATLVFAAVLAGEPAALPARAPKPGHPAWPPRPTLNPRLRELAENTWLYRAPKPTRRLIPTALGENPPMKEVVRGEPAFRSYTSPVYGDGRIFYFGGGHSGYPGNDVEIYDIAENVWRQSYPPKAPPRRDPLYGSGGSPDCYVAPDTGWAAPYTIHGYSRTSFHPVLKRYVCTATFCRKVVQDPPGGKWKCAEKKFSLISYDDKAGKWELLSDGPKGNVSQWDSALGGFLGIRGGQVRLCRDGKVTDYDRVDVRLAATGGTGSVYIPELKSHLFAVMPHGGKNAKA